MRPFMPDPVSRSAARLRYHTQERLRFGDQDSQGHINNAVYSTLFECNRVEFQSGPRFLELDDSQLSVLASVTIDYLRELHWPGIVDIRLGVSAIGRSSFCFEQELWLGDTLISRARSTQVMIDRESRKPVPLSEAQRQQLATWKTDSPVQ